MMNTDEIRARAGRFEKWSPKHGVLGFRLAADVLALLDANAALEAERDAAESDGTMTAEALVEAIEREKKLEAEVEALRAALDEALNIARELRESFPNGSWQHARQSADAADGFDEAWAKYRKARDGARKPSVPSTSQLRSAALAREET